MVIGGIAVNLHGVERPTGDLDLLVSFEKSNLEKFISAMKAIGWVPRLPVTFEEFSDPKKRAQWKKEKGMKVFSIYNPKRPLEPIDVMTEDYIDFDKAYRNRVVETTTPGSISPISIPDLIRLRKIAGRERDKIDIMGLRQAEGYKGEKKKKTRI